MNFENKTALITGAATSIGRACAVKFAMCGANVVIVDIDGTNGQLYVYENKIEITRKEFRALWVHGLKGTKTIPISSIKSIQLKLSGLMAGYIQFAVSRGIEERGGIQTARYDENTITFIRNNQTAKNIQNYIENLILNETNPQTAKVPPTSNADEIKKYKDLLDSGVITQ